MDVRVLFHQRCGADRELCEVHIPSPKYMCNIFSQLYFNWRYKMLKFLCTKFWKYHPESIKILLNSLDLTCIVQERSLINFKKQHLGLNFLNQRILNLDLNHSKTLFYFKQMHLQWSPSKFYLQKFTFSSNHSSKLNAYELGLDSIQLIKHQHKATS